MAISWTLTTFFSCAGTQFLSSDEGQLLGVYYDGTTSCGASCNQVQEGEAFANVHFSSSQALTFRLSGYLGSGQVDEMASITVTRGGSSVLFSRIYNFDAAPHCREPEYKSSTKAITLEPGDYVFHFAWYAHEYNPTVARNAYRNPAYSHNFFLAISYGDFESSSSITESISSESSITISEESNESSSESEPIYNGQTYYSVFKDANDINNPLVGKETQMQFNGYWDASEDGIIKTRNNQASIFCNDASKLFSLSSGYVGMTLSLPFAITNGVYAPLKNDTSTLNEYILWGINVGQYESSQPTLYAALTPRGIEFTILTSEGRQTLLDDVSNIAANTNVFLEFVWSSSEIDNYLVRATLRVDETEIDSGNVPISNESVGGSNFYVLNTPFYYSNMECTLVNLITWDRIPDNLEETWWSSSSSSSSNSSSSSSSNSSSSSSSSLDSSSSSSSSI